MIKRAWLVVSVLWSALCVWLSIMEPPLTSTQAVNRVIVMAVPWLGGLLLYWIVTGRLPPAQG